MAFSERESILPQDITYIGTPIHIKIKVDSATMAFLTFITAMNRMDATKLGTRWRRRI